MKEILIATPEDLAHFASSVLDELKDRQRESATVVALSGELGAGKTTFVQHLARALGVAEYVPSPTFVVMRRYPLSGGADFATLVHIDAYRIDSEEELRPLGFTELIADPGNLICIEWPERIQGALPERLYRISFTTDPADGTVRRVVYGYLEEGNKEGE